MSEIDFKEISKKKILITGGLGFVGVNLVSTLLAKDIKPIVLDFLPENFELNEKYVPFNLDDIDFINLDITNRAKVIEEINAVKPDCIIHLAAMTDLTKDFEQAHHSVNININGTLNLLEAIHDQNIDSFVLLSSSDVYGEVKPPFQEAQKTLPASPYSVSKASAEMYALMFNRVYDIPVTILRSFNVFGKYQKINRVIPYIISTLLKNKKVNLTLGEQKREFNFVENLIDAILLSLLTPESIGKTLNIGNGESITIKKIASVIGTKMDKMSLLNLGAIPYRKNEIWDMYCDNTQAKKILDWEPRISVENGLELTIEWFRKNFE
ncbi:MAG: NAD-dependent epimerase/dehydratase family protein [Candidatus Heimdallarchaeota archaeon]